MAEIKGLTINEADYELDGNKGKGKIAVFMYSGALEPSKVLDFAIKKYVDGKSYHELIDAHLDNPWMRVIISDINNMAQKEFNDQEHRLNSNI